MFQIVIGRGTLAASNIVISGNPSLMTQLAYSGTFCCRRLLAHRLPACAPAPCLRTAHASREPVACTLGVSLFLSPLSMHHLSWAHTSQP